MATDAQRKARNKWLNEKVEHISFRVPIGKKAVIKGYAEKGGETVNGLLNRLVDEEMKRNPRP